MHDEYVLAALEQELEGYRRLLKLAEIQHQHVQLGQAEQLLEVLSRREEILRGLQQLQQILTPIRRRWAEYLAGLDSRLRARTEAVVAQTQLLLHQINLADRNDALVLQQRKLELGRQIQQAGAARQVNRNYGAATGLAQSSTTDLQL